MDEFNPPIKGEVSFTMPLPTLNLFKIFKMADDDRSNDSSDNNYDNTDSLGSNSGGSSLNAFANDGSFLELFKKKMEEEQKKKDNGETTTAGGSNDQCHKQQRKSSLSSVGKRRGGKVLPTGLVKKARKDDSEDRKKDAWSQYMEEVKKYRERSCEDEGKTRPLVK